MAAWEPTLEQIEQIEEWTAQGVTQKAMCEPSRLNISWSQFQSARRRNPQFSQAIKNGKERRSTRSPGRPAWEPSQSQIKKIQELASLGLTYEQIGRYMGYCEETICLKLQEYPELRKAFELGQIEGLLVATRRLRALMQDADSRSSVPATLFYLKSRHGWVDTNAEQLERDRAGLEERITREVSKSLMQSILLQAQQYVSSQFEGMAKLLKAQLSEEEYDRVRSALGGFLSDVEAEGPSGESVSKSEGV